MGGKGLDPELGGEGGDPALSRPGPLPPDLDHLAAADRLVEQSPADPPARLEDDGVDPLGDEQAGGDQTGQSPTHHRDFRVGRFSHPPRYTLVTNQLLTD